MFDPRDLAPIVIMAQLFSCSITDNNPNYHMLTHSSQSVVIMYRSNGWRLKECFVIRLPWYQVTSIIVYIRVAAEHAWWMLIVDIFIIPRARIVGGKWPCHWFSSTKVQKRSAAHSVDVCFEFWQCLKQCSNLRFIICSPTVDLVIIPY